MATPAKGRPGGATNDKQPTLSDVVEAAMKVTGGVGVDGLTMRAVGRELGMTAPTVYYYVKSKGALLDLVADAVLDSIPLPTASEGDWRFRVRKYTIEAKQAFTRYPGIAQVLVREVPSDSMMRGVDYVLSELLLAGLPPTEALHGLSALNSLGLGQGLIDAGRLHVRGPDLRRRLRSVPRPARFQSLSLLKDALHTDAPTDLFEVSVDLVLDALQARIPAEQR